MMIAFDQGANTLNKQIEIDGKEETVKNYKKE